MEEKKRTRPTWAMVRQLEAEIAELKDTRDFNDRISDVWLDEKRELELKVLEMEEVVHSQCQELRGWREKYDELFKESRKKNQKTTSEISNRLLEDEVGRLRSRNEKLIDDNSHLSIRINRLISRGLWSRIINKSV